MAVVYENDCCGCAVPAYPCRGDGCPLRRVPHYYCDECGNETKLYEFEGEQLCIKCVENRLEIVN